MSYRNHQTYNETQKEKHDEKINDFNSSSYQRYQGEKLVNRFNAYSYVTLANAMDSHNVGRGKVSIEKALDKLKAKTLVVGISSDLLFPPHEQEFLAKNIPNSSFQLIDSFYGHDGFLIETKKLGAIIDQFYNSKKNTLLTKNLLGVL